MEEGEQKEKKRKRIDYCLGSNNSLNIRYPGSPDGAGGSSRTGDSVSQPVISASGPSVAPIPLELQIRPRRCSVESLCLTAWAAASRNGVGEGVSTAAASRNGLGVDELFVTEESAERNVVRVRVVVLPICGQTVDLSGL